MKKEAKSGQTWHQTVLREETIKWLLGSGGRYFVDGTVGGGGHALHLLQSSPEARLLGLDRDEEALEQASQVLEEVKDRVVLLQGSYDKIAEYLPQAGFPDKVDGILLDLGVNSHQLETGERGFSFRHDGPLDMRFSNEEEGPTAADLVNNLSEKELAEIFFKWGEERQARKAARAIIKRRSEQPFRRTSELQECLTTALKPKKKSHIDPATRCFQALRIAVNDELGHLERFLKGAIDLLNPKGRIAIISFHSLEDRRVKHQFKEWERDCICPPDFPVCVCDKVSVGKILTRRPLTPSDEEIEKNPRARSAKLRVIERL